MKDYYQQNDGTVQNWSFQHILCTWSNIHNRKKAYVKLYLHYTQIYRLDPKWKVRTCKNKSATTHQMIHCTQLNWRIIIYKMKEMFTTDLSSTLHATGSYIYERKKSTCDSIFTLHSNIQARSKVKSRESHVKIQLQLHAKWYTVHS